MKNLIRVYFVLFVIILCSCGESEKKNMASAKKNVEKNDTIYISHGLSEYHGKEKIYLDTSFDIDGTVHTFSIYAKVNRDKFFEDYFIYEKDGKTVKETFKGYDAEYLFQLKNKNGKKIFSKRMSKNDFRGMVGQDVLTADLLQTYDNWFCFSKGFNSCVIQLTFMLPDSDIGDTFYLFLDKKGDLIYSDFLKSIHGSPESPLEFSSNGTYYVTGDYIQHSNGQKIKISEDNVQQVGTKIINDNYILVVKEKDSSKLPNASLINPYGRMLKAFDYRGYYNTYSYVIPTYFNEANQTYYLLDSEMKNLRLINKQVPEKTYTVDFNKLKPAGNNMLKNEIEFTLTNEMEDFTFYLDTVSGQLRKFGYEE